MKVLLMVVAIANFAKLSVGQRMSYGKCPTVEVQEDFDLKKYVGRWYENRRFYAVFQMFSDCVTAEYTLLEDGSVKVNNTGYSRVENGFITAIGNAGVMGDKPSKLGVTFSPLQPRGQYWVLSTDYESYSIVWSCLDLGIANYQLSWILTRKPEGVTSEKLQELDTLMRKFGINTDHFTVTKQKGCARYLNE